MNAITSVASTNVISTVRNHGFKAGERVEFIALAGNAGLTGRAAAAGVALHAGGTPLAKPTRYFVIAAGLGDKTFEVSATKGGSAVDITTNGTYGYVRRLVRAPGDL